MKQPLILALAATLGLCLTSCAVEQKSSGPPVRLPLKKGLHLTIKQTFLGLGASLQVKGDVGTRFVTLRSMEKSSKTLDWTMKIKKTVEGKSSIETLSGALRIEPGKNARGMLLPVLWPKGTSRETGSGGLWLSRSAFDALASGKKAPWRVGFFENPVARVAQLSSDLSRKLEQARTKVLERARKEGKDLYHIAAEPKRGRFTLDLAGRSVVVETIEAHNWFGRYTILHDRDNPLILKVTLNPLSAGGLDIFSPLGLMKTVMGYQITAVK